MLNKKGATKDKIRIEPRKQIKKLIQIRLRLSFSKGHSCSVP